MDHKWKDWERCLGPKQLEFSARQQGVTGAKHANV